MELLAELKNPFLIADTGFDAGALIGAEGVAGTGTGTVAEVGLDGFIAVTGSCEDNIKIDEYISIQRDKNFT
jgi:hypothetical protein